MKIGKRELVFIFLLLAIPVGAYLMVFVPQNKQNEQMMSEIKARQTKLRALRKATAAVGDLREEIQTLEKAIGFFNSKLPSEREIDKVLREVWLLAQANQLQAKMISTEVKGAGLIDPKAPQGEQPFEIVLTGDFLGLYTFMLALENQPRITRVREMKLSGDATTPGQVNAKFTMSVFYDRKPLEG